MWDPKGPGTRSSRVPGPFGVPERARAVPADQPAPASRIVPPNRKNVTNSTTNV